MRNVASIVVLLLLLVGGSHGANADAAISQRWFQSMEDDDRFLLQAHLTLLGHYDALIDGEFGQGTYRALLHFQSTLGEQQTGWLSSRQVEALEAQGAEMFSILGLELFDDAHAELRFFLPKNILTERAETPYGNDYSNLDRSIVFESVLVPESDTNFADLFTALATDSTDWSVSYSSFKPGRFVVSGRTGEATYYTIFHYRPSKAVGFMATWKDHMNSIGRPLALFNASMASPIAENEVPGTQTPKPESSLASGSGFFFAPKGMILTNHHVVDGCSALEVTGHGVAQTLLSDEFEDLAVIQLKNPPRWHQWAAIRTVKPSLGEEVIMLGYPLADLLNSSLNVGTGIVSAERAVGEHPDWFTTNAGVQSGNSGGPILDLHGNVVGMAVAKADELKLLASAGTTASNIGFAISSKKLLEFVSIFQHVTKNERVNEALSVKQVVEASRDFTVKIVCSR